ncbi:MAG: excinuclease ABC subunit UvrC [Chloroflexi bacterium]|nr:excinuclease ABC subunit UvrC [Chloroflexota bacterium]
MSETTDPTPDTTRVPRKVPRPGRAAASSAAPSPDRRAELARRLPSIPERPGIYVFRDKDRKVLYVGKAVNLRNRVRSYFHGRHELRIESMIDQIDDFELVVTNSEVEALTTEAVWIKQHRPPYNIRMRDDKQYPLIRVSVDESWPRVYVTRRIARDGARYFGPFPNARAVWSTLNQLNKLFAFRRCDFEITGDASRPCLDFHIKRCLGPCIGAVSRDDYLKAIENVCNFLAGKHEAILKSLEAKMWEAADHDEYERAAYYRDVIADLRTTTERQTIVSTALEDEDVIAIAEADGRAVAEVLFIRYGRLVNRLEVPLDNPAEARPGELMASFVSQFYASAPEVPPEILLQTDLAEAEVVQQWLNQRRGDKVTVRVPRRGQKNQLMLLAAENAALALEQMKAKWAASEAKVATALAQLADCLDLAELPQRIECFDISNIQGAAAVGSMVVFENGQPANKLYRKFEIKGVKGPDDFAMMGEVLRRRFKRAQKQAESPNGGKSDDGGWQKLPDLLIVDGGKGQLGIAFEVLTELRVEGVSLAALAKREEEIFIPHRADSILLPRDSEALFLVQRIRDEAHRFALGYHRKLRATTSLRSLLDEVPGIGPRRKALLLKKFGTVEGIRGATVEELATVPGMTKAAAEELKRRL